MVMEAGRGQKDYREIAHFGTLTQRSIHPTVPVLLTKDSPRNEIRYDSQPPFSLHISNSRRALFLVLGYFQDMFAHLKQIWTSLNKFKTYLTTCEEKNVWRDPDLKRDPNMP